MTGLWSFGFFCGALVGSYSAHFTVQPYYRGAAIVCIGFAWWVATHRRRLGRLLMTLAAFLWGAVHQAPGHLPPQTAGLQNLPQAVVLHHNSGGRLRPLIVGLGPHAYPAKGDAIRGQTGSLLMSPSNGLLSRERYFFIATPSPLGTAPANDGLTRATRAFERRLKASLREAPTSQQAWLAALVLGDFKGLPAAIMDAFRHLGLFHLLAISGMHITFLAIALRRLLLSPALLLYSLGLINPRAWLRYRHLAEVCLLAGLFLYVAVLGQGQAAQRALLVYGLHQLGLMCWGTQPLTWRLRLVLSVQTLLFPIAFFSEATLMSWTAYLMVLSFHGLSARRDWLRLLKGQCALFLIVGALWGEGSPVGILINFFFTPLFPTIFFLSLLGVLVPGTAVAQAGQQITNSFLELLVGLDGWLEPCGVLRYTAGLSYGCRLAFLLIASLIFLRTWQELSIRGSDSTKA